jgi:hypothetical protein
LTAVIPIGIVVGPVNPRTSEQMGNEGIFTVKFPERITAGIAPPFPVLFIANIVVAGRSHRSVILTFLLGQQGHAQEVFVSLIVIFRHLHPIGCPGPLSLHYTVFVVIRLEKGALFIHIFEVYGIGRDIPEVFFEDVNGESLAGASVKKRGRQDHGQKENRESRHRSISFYHPRLRI